MNDNFTIEILREYEILLKPTGDLVSEPFERITRPSVVSVQ